MSGDVARDDDPLVVGPDFERNVDNAFHVVTYHALPSEDAAVLDGFTITGGNSDSIALIRRGGGLLITRGRYFLRNCIVVENFAFTGGGGLASGEYSNQNHPIDTFVSVKDCRFENNVAGIEGQDHADGGAILSTELGTLIADSNFSNNYSNHNGGAIFQIQGPISISQSQFVSNHAVSDGGALAVLAIPILDSKATTSDGLFLFVGVNNSVFDSNSAGGWGGAIASSFRTYLFEDEFNKNVAGFAGGALFADAPVQIADTRFVNNSAVASNSAKGGAAWIEDDGIGDSVIIRTKFIQNTAKRYGGGIYFAGIPIVPGMSPISTMWVIDSFFMGNEILGVNSGAGGGAVYASTTRTRKRYVNTVFSGNISAKNGGAVNCSGDYSQEFFNCTFSNNQAEESGGAIYNLCSSQSRIQNSILWGNISPTSTQIKDEDGAIPTHVLFGIVEFGWVNDGGPVDSNILTVNPEFTDINGDDNTIGTEDDNLRLSEGSPAIDSGKNELVALDLRDLDADGNTSEPVPSDIVQVPRFLDDPSVLDTGVAGAGYSNVVDFGAYEFPAVVFYDPTGVPLWDDNVVVAGIPYGSLGSSLQGPKKFLVDVPFGSTISNWSLCESEVYMQNGQSDPNIITGFYVSETFPDKYILELARPITPGAVTALTFTWMVGPVPQEAVTKWFYYHPGNVSGDSQSNPLDILREIDILNGVISAKHGLYSTDADYSGVANPADILRVIDALNGASENDAWNGTSLPERGVCAGVDDGGGASVPWPGSNRASWSNQRPPADPVFGVDLCPDGNPDVCSCVEYIVACLVSSSSTMEQCVEPTDPYMSTLGNEQYWHDTIKQLACH